MDATTWQIISIVGYSLAGALMITAIVLFFKMKVPAIIGDITGRTAARQIQEIREHRGNKRHQPNVFDVDPGIVREPVVSSGLAPVSRPVMEAKGETEDHSRPTLLGSLPTEVLDQDEGGLYPEAFSEEGSEGTEVLVDGPEERYSLTDVLSEERKEKPVSKEDRYALTDVLNTHREGQLLEKEVHYALTDVLNDEKKLISSEGRNVAPGRRSSSNRVVPLSLTEILGSYKEDEPLTADAGKELLLSLTEVLSNEKEVTAEAKSKEREVLLSLTEILSTNNEKPSGSVEVPKEVLLSLTEILSKNTGVAEKGSKEVLSVSRDEREVLRPRTEVLSVKKENLRPRTDVLTNETEVLDYGTELLADDQGTTVLYPTTELENESEKDVPAVSFKVVKDIKVTHTNKKI